MSSSSWCLNAPTGAWCSLNDEDGELRSRAAASQCTYRCVVLPDLRTKGSRTPSCPRSQCTYRCVVLPDATKDLSRQEAEIGLNAPTGAWCSLTTSPQGQTWVRKGLNAPTGAWCSLTQPSWLLAWAGWASQCTYRCVVLPDNSALAVAMRRLRSQCTYRCVVLPDGSCNWGAGGDADQSQCTYRCVVLPDAIGAALDRSAGSVSMHLQVRGAP